MAVETGGDKSWWSALTAPHGGAIYIIYILYAIYNTIYIKNELDNRQLHIIQSSGLPMVTNWRLIWLKGKKMSPVGSAFLSYIQKGKQAIIDEKFSWINNY